MDYENLKTKITAAMERSPLDISPHEDLFALCREYEGEDFAAAHAWNHALRPALARALRTATAFGDLTAAGQFDSLLLRSLLFGAPHFFDDYLQAVEYGKPADKKFYQPRRHYLRRYVDAYQDVLDGKLDFLSISMPKRAIAADCPVLTPDGFKRHGDLKPGDYVYGESGRPVRVLKRHPDQRMEYRITFSNGESIVTSGEHEWVVFDKSRNKVTVEDTKSMEMVGLKTSKGRWKFCLPRPNPVDMPDRELPVKPYTFGAWLGDGTTSKPLLTNDRADYAIPMRITTDGYQVQNVYRDKNYETLIVSFEAKLTEDLRKCGMCFRTSKGDKYIPEVYFTASRRQRLELLAGLIDTDGFVEKGKHRVCISTIFPRLRDDIVRLVSTFGLDCRFYTAKAKVSTSGIVGAHDVHTVTFAPDFDIPTVLPRKKVQPTNLPRRISIRSIERLPEHEIVIGNCITVEGGLYRVGNTQILTHNCGKSQLGINFTNMLSGKYPDRSTLMEGTGDDLVNSFYKGCLEYLQIPTEYHFYDIFPGSRLVQTNADTKIINLLHKSRFPTIMCRSIDARQVGLSEATNLLYLDDCVEGREEAKNRQRLDDKWEIISGDIIGRAIEGTPIVICGTRYSLYDPIGRLQEEMRKQGKRMRVIETPALDLTTDESNFEYVREGKRVFTTQYFRDQRDMLSAEQFESEFQQQPFEAKGLLFPEKSLNRYFKLPVDRDPDSVIAVCDTADKGEDYCAMPIAAVYGTEVYIIDVVFDDSPPEVTKPECAKALMDNKVIAATFESNNAGAYYARDVQEIMTKRGYTCSVRTKRTISNKQTRIEFASDTILKNFYFKDASLYDRNSQYAQFLKQLTTYTRSGKVPHDDAPDSLSLLENELRGLIGAKVEIFRREF